MDLVKLCHIAYTLLVPPLAILFLLFFLPPFLIYKLFRALLLPFFSENMMDKVALITGASSGIGEVRSKSIPHEGLRSVSHSSISLLFSNELLN